jgi:signal transduction histidine kinase
VVGRAFFEDGKANQVVGVVQDVSKRKFEERKQQEKVSAMRILFKQQVAAQTASAIAHELNQPLAAISVYGEVAHQAMSQDSINLNQLNRALQGCVEQAQRAGNTLHELLSFLQQNEIVVEPLDINALVKEAVAIAQNDGFGGFSSQLELQAELPPVFANRLQTQMVLINLMRNGVEAMREAGISPAAITIRVQTAAEGSHVLVTVQDNGPGLSPEAEKRIFDPFFTTKTAGVGMGLSISRALIEANGGRLWSGSSAGVGAVFHFTLPFVL